MAIPSEIKVTSEMLWQVAVIFLLIDVGLAFLFAHRVSLAMFRKLKRTLLFATCVFWCLLWLSMCIFFWEPVYHYVFPEWSRWLFPPVFGVFFGFAGLFFWWLAQRLRGSAAVDFLILGGTWGTVTHVWAIDRGLLEGPPMLQGICPW